MLCRVKKTYSYHIIMSSSDLPRRFLHAHAHALARHNVVTKGRADKKHGAGAPPPPPHPPPFHPDFLKRPILIGKGKKYNHVHGAARTGDGGGGSASRNWQICNQNCETQSVRKSLRLVLSGIRRALCFQSGGRFFASVVGGWPCGLASFCLSVGL